MWPTRVGESDRCRTIGGLLFGDSGSGKVLCRIGGVIFLRRIEWALTPLPERIWVFFWSTNFDFKLTCIERWIRDHFNNLQNINIFFILKERHELNVVDGVKHKNAMDKVQELEKMRIQIRESLTIFGTLHWSVTLQTVSCYTDASF